MKKYYSIGIDFGTNAVRTLLLDITEGKEIYTASLQYSCGDKGILSSSENIHLAREEPSDCIPAVLCGVKNADEIKHNLCAAGHKAMYSSE